MKVFLLNRAATLLLAAVVLMSCSENEQRLVEKGFERAAQQYELMYEATPLGMYPRTVNNSGETRLIGAEPLKSGANWTNGFYPGVLWMLYEHTGDVQWKAKAENVTRALEVQKNQIYHHDIGFIIMASFGKAYEYCPSEYYKNVIVHAAGSQLSRFSEITGTTKSWDKLAKQLAQINYSGNLDYETLMVVKGDENLVEVAKEVYKQACELESMIKKYKKVYNKK